MQKLAILFRGSGFQIDEISGNVSTSYITKINLGSIHEYVCTTYYVQVIQAGANPCDGNDRERDCCAITLMFTAPVRKPKE